MKAKLWVYTSITVLLILSACTQAVPSGSQSATGEAVPVTGDEIDQMFIDMMVPHHQGAVEMANIARERSQRPEIRQLADDIIASQDTEIQMMRDWRQQWYGSSDTPPMSAMPMLQEMEGMGGMGHTMDMQADVDQLRAASEPFDLAFIDAMIPHHQSAIDTAQLVLNSAVHPELRTMAQQIIADQQKEIDQMLAWRQEWFADAPTLVAPSH